MPLKPFQLKTQNHRVNLQPVKANPKTLTKNDDSNQHHHNHSHTHGDDMNVHSLNANNTTKYNDPGFSNGVRVGGDRHSAISSDSEWVLFSPFDEHAHSYEYDNSNSGGTGADDRIDDVTVADDPSNSVLSTRYSSYSLRSTNELNTGYVISDFDQSYISDNDGRGEGDDDADNDEDLDDDDEFIDSDDGGSLIDEVRDDINTLNKNKLDELTMKNQNELINKINDWKLNIASVASNGTSLTEDTYAQNPNKANSTKTNKGNSKSKSQSQLEREKEKEIKVLRKVVGKLYTALKNDYDSKGLVGHEGIFMNNPDLESCVPGYWKRIMLDNLMQFNIGDHNSILGINNDDINKSKINNKNFWEIDESGSVQSVSTGLDANYLHGFY